MKRSRDWLFQANGDLDYARLDLTHGFNDWACFSAQQSANKAVKAVINRLEARTRSHLLPRGRA